MEVETVKKEEKKEEEESREGIMIRDVERAILAQLEK